MHPVSGGDGFVANGAATSTNLRMRVGLLRKPHDTTRVHIGEMHEEQVMRPVRQSNRTRVDGNRGQKRPAHLPSRRGLFQALAGRSIRELGQTPEVTTLGNPNSQATDSDPLAITKKWVDGRLVQVSSYAVEGRTARRIVMMQDDVRPDATALVATLLVDNQPLCVSCIAQMSGLLRQEIRPAMARIQSTIDLSGYSLFASSKTPDTEACRSCHPGIYGERRRSGSTATGAAAQYGHPSSWAACCGIASENSKRLCGKPSRCGTQRRIRVPRGTRTRISVPERPTILVA